ncbi:FHA domain-containing protein [Acaryochloris marina]|uniref:FHA domain-containing protein n=1 Tax=Acaryochloris marina TaxID=155978 RepID=UPI001BAF5D2C|nr:FHA domain-containing protein [Acaryochloris marina]QUY43343.1 FHA domain-containing protein [Acaryochloris marina S15]
MTELTLEWVEGGVSRSEQIQPNQPSKNPGTVRIGRDPQKCDVVLSDSSVSGLQAEVYYHAGSQVFYLRSLRDTNPPIVNGQPITTGEVPLGTASTVSLGRVVLNARVSGDGGIPPTEVNQPGGVPPTTVSSPAPAAPPPYPSPSPTPYYQAPPPAGDQGPKVWVWIVAGVLVIGGGALAWPYVSNFLGLSKEPTVSQSDSTKSNSDQDSSDSSPSSRGESFGDKMADLVTYEHSSGLFQIKTPRTWRRKDTSKAGEVILRWTDSETDSSIVVDLFKSRRLSEEELGNLSRRFITNAFGKETGFKVGQPKVQDSGVVELGWEFSTRNDQVLGATYTEQSGDTISVVSILVLRSDFDQVRSTFREILQSYRFDPAVAIP